MLVFANSFVMIGLSLLLIWLGFGKLETKQVYSNDRHNDPSERYSGSIGGFSLIHRLRKEFTYQTPENILSGVIASISVHIAKSDGRISEEEMNIIRSVITERFRTANQDYIKSIVDITKKYIDEIGLDNLFQSIILVIELYLSLINTLDRRNQDSLTFLMFGLLYEVAMADGAVHPNEEILFQRICSYFQIPRDYQAQIKRTAFYNFTARKNSGKKYTFNYNQPSDKNKLKQSLEYFGLNMDYSIQDLEKAWKKIVVMYHPDKYHNQGEETYKQMNDKFVEGQKMYEYLKERLIRK
jgi:DnaJ like chaperone protein